MAQKTIIQLVDDLDGTEIKDGKGETVLFSLDGVDYQIDLMKVNAEALRKVLKPYVSVATKLPKRSRKPAAASKDNPAEIRAWAKQNGFADLPDRGRIPANVMDAWNAK